MTHAAAIQHCFYVDIPKHPDEQSEAQEYRSVAKFHTKEAAIAYCMEHFGSDDKGNINLISGG